MGPERTATIFPFGPFRSAEREPLKPYGKRGVECFFEAVTGRSPAHEAHSASSDLTSEGFIPPLGGIAAGWSMLELPVLPFPGSRSGTPRTGSNRPRGDGAKPGNILTVRTSGPFRVPTVSDALLSEGGLLAGGPSISSLFPEDLVSNRFDTQGEEETTIIIMPPARPHLRVVPKQREDSASPAV